MALSAVACRLTALQSRLPPIAARKLPFCRLTGCSAAATLPLSLCSHGLSLRQSQALQAPLIITTIYGNPLSSQHALTSWGLTSYISDDILRLCIYAKLLHRVKEGGMGNDEFSSCPAPCCGSSSDQFSLSHTGVILCFVTVLCLALGGKIS